MCAQKSRNDPEIVSDPIAAKTLRQDENAAQKLESPFSLTSYKEVVLRKLGLDKDDWYKLALI